MTARYPAVPAVDDALARGDRTAASRALDAACTDDDGTYVGPDGVDDYVRRRADATRGAIVADVVCPACDAVVARVYDTPYGALLRAGRPYPEAMRATRNNNTTNHTWQYPAGGGWPYPATVTLEMVARLAAGVGDPDMGPAPLHCRRHGDLGLPDGPGLAAGAVVARRPRSRRARIPARRAQRR